MANLIFQITTGNNENTKVIHTCHTPTEVKEFIDLHPDLPKETRVVEYTVEMGYRDCLCLTFLKASGLIKHLDKYWSFW